MMAAASRKSMSLNVFTKRVQIAPPMAKVTESVSDMKKFESRKRKYEERLAVQSEAKRRIVMVDFHRMPKPAKDPRAPKRCWDTRREKKNQFVGSPDVLRNHVARLAKIK
ncbi:hypothetical protein BC332_02540 [Capsicum chinense]|nr:hypothetical protein BC332_02540 [Capsicum chinense]